MSKVRQATPYTPIFPSSFPVIEASSSASTSSNDNTAPNKSRRRGYIDKIKERHVLLANLPIGDLCPPSRETSPEAESRIEALRLRMRKGHHIPELTLACCGLRGGDWIGHPVSDSDEEKDYVLPNIEAEWFEWKRKKTQIRGRRLAQKEALERRERITRWTGQIEEAVPAHHSNPSEVLAPSLHATSKATLNQSQPSPLPHEPESVDPVSSLRLSISVLDHVLDPSSFILPNTPPSLPQLEDNPPFPVDIPPTPSFCIRHKLISTPQKRDSLDNSVLQLSSPISPPRSLHSLTAPEILPFSQQKRSHEAIEDVSKADAPEEPTTPRSVKKANIIPITPTSVARPNVSQASALSQDHKRLPTLTQLLSARKTSRSKSKGTPSRTTLRIPSSSPSQPTYAMFRPQFQSTQQRRAWSLPPSSNEQPTSTQPNRSQKSIGGTASSSSGIGFYHSQFNVENKVEEVTAFLNTDVWEVET